MSRFEHASPDLPALEAADRIRAGALTSVELVTACLDRVEQAEPELRAWAEIERDTALELAREMDALRQHGLPLGALHGVPVAIGVEFGRSSVSVGHGEDTHPNCRPPQDASPAVVERLREAGAVVVGRTRAVEPLVGPTDSAIHPQDGLRTAGAPCGNAAAAVGAGHVPFAVTCEAHGGVMLSASYCGVYGFRPARGVVSRRGAVSLSPTLDQAGILGRTLEDVALLADVLGGYDSSDAASYLRPRPRMLEGVRSTPPVEPDFIWLDMPYHDCLSAASRAGVEELCDCLGTRVARFPAPAWFGRLPAAHRIIVEHETAERWRMRGEQSSASLTEMAERGFAHGEELYRAALSEMKQAQRYFSSLFHEHDAVIAPATAGEAPLRMSTDNDDLVFCATWVLCGLPILCVPLLQGDSGLPIGMQLIGSAHQDDRLLRTGRWLIDRILGDAG